VPQSKLHPRTALIVLTALNLLNYADRNVLYAVQPLVQDEFHLNKTQIGYLTSAFLGFYMIAAPFVGPLADRYSRKLIIVAGAIFWSGLTLLTAVTHTYGELLVRHTLVGVGEATFVTIAPTFVADLFSENVRGRILECSTLRFPLDRRPGIWSRYLAPIYGWRFPFYIAAAPGFVLALAVLFLKEPEARAVRFCARDAGAGDGVRFGSQPRFPDRYARHGLHDLFTRRHPGLGCRNSSSANVTTRWRTPI